MHVILMLSAQCKQQEVGSRDCDRSLTSEGRKDIIDAADFINRLDITPKKVLTGPFQRAKDTGDIFAANFKKSPNVEIVPGLMPGAGPEELMKAIANRSTRDSKEWMTIVIHYSDTDFILGEILGEKKKLNFLLCPGMIIGVDLAIVKGKLTGRILFTRYPGALN